MSAVAKIHKEGMADGRNVFASASNVKIQYPIIKMEGWGDEPIRGYLSCVPCASGVHDMFKSNEIGITIHGAQLPFPRLVL